MTKTLSVSAIENGTVIDHIPAGQSVRMIRLLKFSDHKTQVTIGVNLRGKRGLKDLIKMENRQLSEYESQKVAIFAPEATVNIVEDFKIVKKYQATPPSKVEGLLVCPNPGCISNKESVVTCFTVSQKQNHIHLHCHYCEKLFLREEFRDEA